MEIPRYCFGFAYRTQNWAWGFGLCNLPRPQGTVRRDAPLNLTLKSLTRLLCAYTAIDFPQSHHVRSIPAQARCACGDRHIRVEGHRACTSVTHQSTHVLAECRSERRGSRNAAAVCSPICRRPRGPLGHKAGSLRYTALRPKLHRSHVVCSPFREQDLHGRTIMTSMVGSVLSAQHACAQRSGRPRSLPLPSAEVGAPGGSRADGPCVS